MPKPKKAQPAPKKSPKPAVNPVVLEGEDRIPVRYIANKGIPETDTIVKLDWEHGTVHVVTRKQASHLLYWGDTFEDARQAHVRLESPVIPEEWKPYIRHDEMDKYPMLVPLQSMDQQALQIYSVRSFNEHLPADMPVEQMRTTIMQFMNRPM